MPDGSNVALAEPAVDHVAVRTAHARRISAGRGQSLSVAGDRSATSSTGTTTRWSIPAKSLGLHV